MKVSTLRSHATDQENAGTSLTIMAPRHKVISSRVCVAPKIELVLRCQKSSQFPGVKISLTQKCSKMDC
jgi:hypothetical protein